MEKDGMETEKNIHGIKNWNLRESTKKEKNGMEKVSNMILLHKGDNTLDLF